MNSQNSSSNERKVIVAILNDSTAKWDYLKFDTREEARQAINEARSEGKAAVFYQDENDDDGILPEL